MPWQLKALVQFVFAYAPFGERLNHLAQIANGSFSPRIALREFIIQLRYVSALNARFPLAGITAIEIGPGWQGVGTLALALMGVKTYAFDVQPHLRARLLRELVNIVSAHGREVAEITGIPQAEVARRLDSFHADGSLSGMLAAMDVVYRAPADARHTELADRSVDLVYSYGVLEHIGRVDLEAIARETVRVLKPTGRASHDIGLHDHFDSAGASGVNFLKYPEWLWALVSYNKILYHNRMRLPEYLEMFAACGLAPAWSEKEILPGNLAALRSLRVHQRFLRFSEADLAASQLCVDLQHSVISTAERAN